ncbi:hypothetical protein [Methylobacterium iners]|uniref:Secreted protein n=1 Tax=Methylobacterium iners TaxID=418707 RepID=A0ABQ4S6R5_9HYPH|nr:hypothetical protein OCOJLMKI_4806 [Methylobacterium iners]
MTEATTLGVAALVLATSVSSAADSGTIRPRCITHDHQPLQIRRMPFASATTSKPRNPLQDEAVHCEDLRQVGEPDA